MKTVHEVSRISGVSVRTLHHYDAVGLLKPTAVTDAGYRLYDDAALCRLQEILLFRELEFPLREIRNIIDNPGFDRKKALIDQIKLLELKKEHLNGLLTFTRSLIEKEDVNMDFSAFDKTELEQYSAEAKKRWGNTDEYRESAERESKRTDDENVGIADGLMRIFAEIGKLRKTDPNSKEAQDAVTALRQYITDNYYNCNVQTLEGLGMMYVGDERFKKNIDRAGGEGTAEFANEAIRAYCSGKR